MRLLFAVLLVSFQTHAARVSGREAWRHADKAGKAEIIRAYQQFFAEASKLTPAGEWQGKAVSLRWLILDAWAAVPSDFDCVYAGYPSKRVGGLCSSPARNGHNYPNPSGCAGESLRCQPLLFGGADPALCAPAATPRDRNRAFSSCERQFQESGRTPEQVVAWVMSNDKEAALGELLDYADRMCTPAFPAQRPMCRLLEAGGARVRAAQAAARAAAEQGAAEFDLDEVERILAELPRAPRVPQACENQTKEGRPTAPPVVSAPQKPALTITTSPPSMPATSTPGPVSRTATVRDLNGALANFGIPPGDSILDDGLYSPAEALADVNASPLQFLDRIENPDADPHPDYGRGGTCVFENEQVYVLFNNCRNARVEADATEIYVVARRGGVARFFLEDAPVNTVGSTGVIRPPSTIPVSDYGNVNWSVTTLDAPVAGNLDLQGIGTYLDGLGISRGEISSAVTGFCRYGGRRDMLTVDSPLSLCQGSMADRQAAWDGVAEGFWRNPGSGWSSFQQGVLERSLQRR